MSKQLQKYSIQEIENRIFTIRGTHVMIDRDIADMYDVETKVLNQAVKRNLERFPENFRFQLIKGERDELVTNCDRLRKHNSQYPKIMAYEFKNAHDRFPDDFMFYLTDEEVSMMVSQNAMPSKKILGGRKYALCVFKKNAFT